MIILNHKNNRQGNKNNCNFISLLFLLNNFQRKLCCLCGINIAHHDAANAPSFSTRELAPWTCRGSREALPFCTSRSWKRAWQNHGRRCQRRRTFLRKDLTLRVAVARVPRRRKRKRRRWRVKSRGERGTWEKEERDGERAREGMSFPLKKSCPNKGVLFHAQCTPPQTRSLRYLSLRGARCSFTLLSTPHEFPFPSFLSLWNPREWRVVPYRFMSFYLRRYRGEVVRICDNSLISRDTWGQSICLNQIFFPFGVRFAFLNSKSSQTPI